MDLVKVKTMIVGLSYFIDVTGNNKTFIFGIDIFLM